MLVKLTGQTCLEIQMAGRVRSRLHLALFCLIALGALQIHAQTTGIFLCIGSASTNFQLANYQACSKANAATVSSFAFGASLQVSSTGGTVTVGSTSVTQFTLQKNVDETTKSWAKSLYSNSPVTETLVIGINTPGPGGNVNVTIRLTNPRVIQFSHSGDGVQTPSETVSMSYDSITVYDNSTSPTKVVQWSGT
jgi:type VI protein secretion system component Hcp